MNNCKLFLSQYTAVGFILAYMPSHENSKKKPTAILLQRPHYETFAPQKVTARVYCFPIGQYTAIHQWTTLPRSSMLIVTLARARARLRSIIGPLYTLCTGRAREVYFAPFSIMHSVFFLRAAEEEKNFLMVYSSRVCGYLLVVQTVPAATTLIYVGARGFFFWCEEYGLSWNEWELRGMIVGGGFFWKVTFEEVMILKW